MKRPNFLNEIKQKILNAENGTVFVAVDFVDLTDKTTVSVCLTRLENENIIQRILRGVYYKAEYNEFLQEYVVVVGFLLVIVDFLLVVFESLVYYHHQ